VRVYILSITKVRSWDYSIDTFARFVLLYMYLKSSKTYHYIVGKSHISSLVL